MSDLAPPPGEGAEARKTVTVVNKRGLHARAAAKFVKLAATFQAEATVERAGMTVGGQSIMGLMMLAASPGTTIEIAAVGPDAAAAVDALVALVEARFEEE